MTWNGVADLGFRFTPITTSVDILRHEWMLKHGHTLPKGSGAWREGTYGYCEMCRLFSRHYAHCYRCGSGSVTRTPNQFQSSMWGTKE